MFIEIKYARKIFKNIFKQCIEIIIDKISSIYFILVVSYQY